jgi:hypothetical protein
MVESSVGVFGLGGVSFSIRSAWRTISGGGLVKSSTDVFGLGGVWLSIRPDLGHWIPPRRLQQCVVCGCTVDEQRGSNPGLTKRTPFRRETRA